MSDSNAGIELIPKNIDNSGFTLEIKLPPKAKLYGIKISYLASVPNSSGVHVTQYCVNNDDTHPQFGDKEQFVEKLVKIPPKIIGDARALAAISGF
mmetsp:Transcript_3119/g.2687  ORF Transcript_3119/g.2687 Transcript_3119/m.2687 type:complete len:96 (-) Transcript_3119:1011-1298(-)